MITDHKSFSFERLLINFSFSFKENQYVTISTYNVKDTSESLKKISTKMKKI